MLVVEVCLQMLLDSCDESCSLGGGGCSFHQRRTERVKVLESHFEEVLYMPEPI